MYVLQELKNPFVRDLHTSIYPEGRWFIEWKVERRTVKNLNAVKRMQYCSLLLQDVWCISIGVGCISNGLLGKHHVLCRIILEREIMPMLKFVHIKLERIELHISYLV